MPWVSPAADIDKVERQKVIAPLQKDQALLILDDESLGTRLKLWDAQKRKENMKLAAQMGDIESAAAVTEQIEKDIARHKSNMQDIDQQINKHRPVVVALDRRARSPSTRTKHEIP